MTETQWYYADIGQQRQGPLPTGALRRLHQEGAVDIDTVVWCEGMPQWKPLHSVAELSRAEPEPPPPQVLAPAWEPASASAHDPYAAPASSLVPGNGGGWAAPDASQQAYAAFVGSNFPVYRRKWRLDRPGHNASGWHWPAFLFGAFWMLYRRMYAVAAGWIAALVGLSFLEALVNASSALSTAITFGASATAGALGNHLYLRHADRIIAQARATYRDNAQALHAELAARGGTRWSAVVLGLLAYVAVLGGLSFLFDS